MKARVIETGEIVDVEHIIHTSSDGRKVEYYESENAIYVVDALDFDVKEKSFPKDEPDYWEKLKHQYAGMAMHSLIIKDCSIKEIVETSSEIATALVNKLNEE